MGEFFLHSKIVPPILGDQAWLKGYEIYFLYILFPFSFCLFFFSFPGWFFSKGLTGFFSFQQHGPAHLGRPASLCPAVQPTETVRRAPRPSDLICGADHNGGAQLPCSVRPPARTSRGELSLSPSPAVTSSADPPIRAPCGLGFHSSPEFEPPPPVGSSGSSPVPPPSPVRTAIPPPPLRHISSRERFLHIRVDALFFLPAAVS